MVIAKPPFIDSISKDLLVIPKGSYAFLKTALTVGGAVTPPAGDFHTDPNVYTLTDPDSSPIAWATNALDPEDSDDIWDENHANYAGTLGIFADGAGRIALKILVPLAAEETHLDSSRAYQISWKVKRPNGEFITGSEVFNVGPAGLLSFVGSIVTVASIRADYETPLTDPEILDIIAKADANVRGILQQVITPPFVDSPAVTRAVQNETYRLLVFKEVTTGRWADSLSQGGMSMSRMSADKAADLFKTERNDAVKEYLAAQGIYGFKAPSVDVFRKLKRSGVETNWAW